MDKILITGIPLHCRLGVSEKEREQPQEIVVDVELGLDVRRAATSDSIEDTVNYSRVCDALEEVAVAREYKLIETVVESMASRLLMFTLIERALVRVKKPRALAHRGVMYPAVEIVRDRS